MPKAAIGVTPFRTMRDLAGLASGTHSPHLDRGPRPCETQAQAHGRDLDPGFVP